MVKRVFKNNRFQQAVQPGRKGHYGLHPQHLCKNNHYSHIINIIYYLFDVKSVFATRIARFLDRAYKVDARPD